MLLCVSLPQAVLFQGKALTVKQMVASARSPAHNKRKVAACSPGGSDKIMPIRFRCSFCGQLLGIARRKAGTRVNCTKCGHELLVPTPDDQQRPAVAVSAVPASSSSPPARVLEDPFERDEIEALLHAAPPPVPLPSSAAMATSSATPAVGDNTAERGGSAAWRSEGGREALPVAATSLPPAQSAEAIGLVLSPIQATVLTVVLILLLALSFLSGLLIGRFVL